MIWNEQGVPKVDMASDFRDSAMLAGNMLLFEHPKAPYPGLYLNKFNRIVRCPGDDACDTSKDNSIGLILYVGRMVNVLPVKDDYRFSVERLLKNSLFQNGDPLSPTNRLAINWSWYRKEGTIFEHLWLWLDLFFSTKIYPWNESNQLLQVLRILPVKYMKWYIKHHPDWKKCLRLYWHDPDRMGQDICEHMISKIESWTNQ